MVLDAEALWGKLHVDDAGIDRIAFTRERNRPYCAWPACSGLIASEPKTEVTCMLPKGIKECPFTISAGGQTCKRTDRFVYLGRTITADGTVDKEIASRVCRSWKKPAAKRRTTGGASTAG